MGGSKKIEIKDLPLILTPNEHAWSEKESELISDSCKYSSTFPAKENNFPPEFDDIEEISGIPDAALFKYDATYVSPSSVETYFAEEDAAAKKHNHILAELKIQADELNAMIPTYNERMAQEKLRYRLSYSSVYDQEKEKYKKVSEAYLSACKAQKRSFSNMLKEYGEKNTEAVIKRLDYVLQSIKLPNSIPFKWKVDFDPLESIAIVEIRLPDVVHSEIFKTVQLKSGAVLKPLNQKEFRDTAPNIHPAILLRTAYEVFRNDTQDVIDLLVVNGWVEFDDPTTGNTTKTYTASLAVTKDKILSLNLQKLDPLAAFMSLKGKTAGKLIDIIPVTPILSLDRKDKRFISTKEVLNKLGSETNLAAMDWQDFESLIAELFEKEFAKEGAEVKVTQASRDRGVDAIVFDPDPIKGGKFIIQAKRYTHTVDVSAVRDLCAVVKKEGALKGLLVTTSTYGADAYAFAQNEPITLLNGAELLGMLEKHGYKFRINLVEARNLMKAPQ